MKNLSKLILAAVLAFPLTSAASESYIGVQYGQGIYSEDAIDEEWFPTVATLRFGRHITSNVSIELRAGSGHQSDEQTLFLPGAVDTDLAIRQVFGIHGLFHMDINSRTAVYGLAGFSRAEAKANVGGVTNSAHETGVSFGGGFRFGDRDNTTVDIEYVQYLSEEILNLGVLSVGLTIPF